METQNFVIRETRFSDYEYFTKWECDENITKYMSFDENRSYEDVVTEALYSKKDPTKLDYTIVARENGKPVEGSTSQGSTGTLTPWILPGSILENPPCGETGWAEKSCTSCWSIALPSCTWSV